MAETKGSANSLADMLMKSPDQLSQLQDLQKQTFEKQLESEKAQMMADLMTRANNPVAGFMGALEVNSAVESKRQAFVLQQQEQLLTLQAAAQAKMKSDANIQAVARELGMTDAQIKRAVDTGSLKAVGEEVKAVTEGQVQQKTAGSQIALAAANVDKAKADALQSRASAASSFANAEKTKVETQGALIANARALQAKEGDWINEKQLDGSVKRVQLGKLPDGMQYVQNADGTYTMNFDVSKDAGQNKAAVESLQTMRADITKKSRDIGMLQQLSADPELQAAGDISDAMVVSAKAKKAAGAATSLDNKILAFDDAIKGSSVFDLKSVFGAQLSDGERTAYFTIQGTVASPKLRRDWNVAYASSAQKTAEAKVQIMDAAIARGVAPAKAATYAAEATKAMAGTETLRALMNAGNSELIRKQYKVLRDSGYTDAQIQGRLGADAQKLTIYLR